jgi:hypothetical protein
VRRVVRLDHVVAIHDARTMRHFQVMAFAVAAFAASSVAHEAPRKVPDAELHRPTPMPDRVTLTWSGDPATTQAVTWRTDPTIRKALAQIAAATPGPGFAGQSKQYDATTTSLTTDIAPAHYHSVEFAGLSPGTKYAYRVGDGINWSEWFQFRTASSKSEPFAFVYFGDAQTDIKSLWSRVIRQAYGDVPDLRFMVHAGDLINNANNDAQWGEWFAGGGWANAMVSSVPSPGNHEYFREESEFEAVPRRLSGHWAPQFTLPQNGPEGLKESVYFFDYQGVRIVSLDSNRLHERQAEWLDATLSDNPCAWTVIAFHHPIYSPGKRRDNPELRRTWRRCSTSTGWTSCSPATTTVTPARASSGSSIPPAPGTSRPASGTYPAGRSTSSRSAAPRCTRSTARRARDARPRIRSSTRSSASTAPPFDSRPARRWETCTMHSSCGSGRGRRTNWSSVSRQRRSGDDRQG